MLILQGTWLEHRLQIWGEAAPVAGAAARVSRTRRTRNHVAELRGFAPSPFDPGPLLLGKVVEALAASRAAARARHVRPAVAWLPSAHGRPIPSYAGLWPPDLPAIEASSAPADFQPWRINILPLSWPEQCAILSACANGPVLGRRLHVGRSLIAWSRLWRLAGALVARQAYLPDVQRVGDGPYYESLWRPVLNSDDRRRLQQLATQTPPSALCVSLNGQRPNALEGGEVALAAAHDFLEQAVDRLIRDAVTTPLTRAQALKARHSGAHAAWLASLRGDGRRVRCEEAAELEQLANALAAWRRPLMLGHDGNYHLVFRLDEPVQPDAQPALWRLKIFVKSVARPTPYSLWELRHAPPQLREFGLTALGQAAALSACLRTDATEDTPDGIPLDTGQAHLFLTQDIAVLRAAGFDVQPPAWWQDPTTENPVRLQVLLKNAIDDPGSVARLGLDQLVDVNWSLILGGHAITAQDLKALLGADTPLVRWQGRWIAVDRAAATAALRELKVRQKRPVSLRELLRLSIGAAAADGVRIETGDFARPGVLGDLMSRLRGDARIDPLPPPESFQGELRPYQLRGLAWLAWLWRWGLGACLADDMGLGKTIQALALFLHTRTVEAQRPILLVCPLSLIANWRHEAARFAPTLSVLQHYGANRAPGRLLLDAANQHDLVITSYALLCRDFAALARVSWSMVVLDEAQNIKNPATLQSRAARALTADFRLALTGTPVENHVGDLWALMDFLNPGLLGTRAHFNTRFQRPIRTGADSGAGATLRQLVHPFILRRLKSDPDIVADLPDRVENKVYCNLTPEQATLYASELRRLDTGLADADGIARRGLVLATLTRLKQICNHPAHYLAGVEGTPALRPGSRKPVTADPLAEAGRSGKLERFDALVEEVVNNGECALVFTQYAVMGTLLQNHLRERLGCEIPFLHGGIAREARGTMIARFQSEAGPPIFILSLKAGGTGLNLTRANHVFHFDRWWNPAVENQATDRAHRIGQTRNVFVHKFICSGTLESRIDALIEGKLSLAEDVVGSGESWLTQLSNDRLREVLALSADAVASDGEDLP